MADRNHHRILRQVLELELASATRAPEFQEAAAHLFRNQTPPALEALFDRLAGPDEILCVDRLELDLGTLQGPDWQEHFLTRLLQQLQRFLEQAARSPAGNAQWAAPADGAGIPFQQLLFFLAHGRLPWWGGQPDNGWIEALLERLDAGQWQALGVLLRSDSRARRRLIHTASDSFLAVALEAMTGLTQALHVLVLLTPADFPPEQSRHWRLHFWMLLLGLVADGTPGPAHGTHLMQQLLEQRGVLAQRQQHRDQGARQGQHSRDGDTEASEFPPLPQPWQGWLEGAARDGGKSQTISADAPPRGGKTRTEPERHTDAPTQPSVPWEPPAGSAPRQDAPTQPSVPWEPPAPADAPPRGGETRAEPERHTDAPTQPSVPWEPPAPTDAPPRGGETRAEAERRPDAPTQPSVPWEQPAGPAPRQDAPTQPSVPWEQPAPTDAPPRGGETRAEAERRPDTPPRPSVPWEQAAGPAPRQEATRHEPPAGPPLPHPHGKQPDRTAEPDRGMASAARQHVATPLQEGEVVYLEGAGAVILHPFLEELFRSRALLQERAFRDAAAQYRAVYLLGYLTFGSDEVPEYDLLLPKLLCGLPWEEPLPPGRLLVEERAACDELLGAVLSHWSALKSTSPVWMREQFFLRQGKLERLDANWRLTVEHRLQDVLLDRLPWGVSIIRFPWMQGLLYVRWTD